MSVPHTHEPGAELAQVHVHTDGAAAVPVAAAAQPVAGGVAVSAQPATVVATQPVAGVAGAPMVAPVAVGGAGHTVVTAQAAATVPVKRPNTPVFAYIATFLMTIACALFFIATTSDQMVSYPVVNNLSGYNTIATTGAITTARTVTAYGVSEGLWRVCYESAVAYPGLPVPLGPNCARLTNDDCDAVFETNSLGALPNGAPYSLPYSAGGCRKVNAVRAFCILAVIWSVAAIFSMAYNVWNAMYHDPYHHEAHNAAHGTAAAANTNRGGVQTDPGVAHPARSKEEVSRGSRAAGILALLAALMGMIAFAIAYDHYISGYPVKLIGHSLMALIVAWPLATLAFLMWIIPTPHVDWNELWVSRFGSLVALTACVLFVIAVATRRFVYYTDAVTNVSGQVIYTKNTIGLWNSCAQGYNLAANVFTTTCTTIDNECDSANPTTNRRCALLRTIRAFIIIAAILALISTICKFLSRAGHKDHYDERHNLKNGQGVTTTGVHVPHTEPHATGVAPAAGADRSAPSVGQPANANTVDARHPNGDTHEVDDRAVALALLFGLLSAGFGFAAMAIACTYYAQPATNWGYSFYLLVIAWNLMLVSTALVAWARYHHRIPDSSVTAIATATATPHGTQSVPTIIYPTNSTTDGSQVGVYYPLWSDRIVRLLTCIAFLFLITAMASPDWVYVRERALHTDQYYNRGSQFAFFNRQRSTQYGLWRVCFNLEQCSSISSDRDCTMETLVSTGALPALRDCRMYNGFRASAMLTTLLALCFVACQWVTYCLHSRKHHHRNMGSNVVRYFGVFFGVVTFIWGIITIALCHRYFDVLASEYALSFWLFLTAWLILGIVTIMWWRPFVHHRAWSRSLQALLTLLALLAFILTVAYPSFARSDYDSSYATINGNTLVMPVWYTVGRENDLGRDVSTGVLNSTSSLANVFVPYANGTASSTSYAALLAASSYTNARTTVTHGLFYSCVHNATTRQCRWLNNDCSTRDGDVQLPGCDTFNVTRAFVVMALIMAAVSLLLRICNLCAVNNGPHAFAGIANFLAFLFALVAVAAGLHWIRNSLLWSSSHTGPSAVLLIVGFLLELRLVLAWWREPKWHKMHKRNDPSVTSADFLDRDGAFLC